MDDSLTEENQVKTKPDLNNIDIHDNTLMAIWIQDELSDLEEIIRKGLS